MSLPLVVKRIFVPLTAFLLLSYFVAQHLAFFSRWVSLFLPLAYGSLLISAVIAWRFGRSRLVFIALSLFAFLLFDNKLLIADGFAREHVVYALACLSGLIIWQKDKGLQPQNAIITTLVLLGGFALCMWQLPNLLAWVSTQMTGAASWYYQHGAELGSYLIFSELVLFSSLVILAFIRLCIVPDNTHMAIFILLLAIIAIHIFPDIYYAQLLVTCLSAGMIIAVFIDSFNMAFRDELTTIPSRRALMQYVQTLGRKYSVVMADIDHFKGFNDTYGHDVGDEVIKLVAKQLSQVSGGGRAFRYGGEEFTIIFPNKYSHEVKPYVEMLRESIANYPIVLRNPKREASEQKAKKGKKKAKQAQNKTAKQKRVSITCSFGVAERSKEHKDFSQIMKQADVALYAAKQAGRNCVQIAPQSNHD